NYVYIILQRGEKDFELACKGLGFEDWLTNPDFNTADARDRHKQEIYDRIGKWTADKTKFEVVETLSKFGVPVGPVLSTKEVMTDESLYDGNTLVKIDQGGEIGEFVTVGCPFTMSSFQPSYGPCPALGGDTADVLKAYGYTDDEISQFTANGTTAPLPKNS
ncbi:MAG: CoA transferase, partial [Muribaculaceae bacterium]|nr:CoA transferase [Muribaculaceae bacterium]